MVTDKIRYISTYITLHLSRDKEGVMDPSVIPGIPLVPTVSSRTWGSSIGSLNKYFFA